jgi:hypothetical protein
MVFAQTKDRLIAASMIRNARRLHAIQRRATVCQRISTPARHVKVTSATLVIAMALVDASQHQRFAVVADSAACLMAHVMKIPQLFVQMLVNVVRAYVFLILFNSTIVNASETRHCALSTNVTR